ncbi:hypothetical protein BB558_002287 [Smittium angustum]|uniref:Actinin-like protein n=1 Tax=Smittium angustum TaxID=133377 RepID=A0A2U1J942_SMIAN|nr:hypothetical protein BB558_002287 [Smittium angustum]
MFLQNSSRRPQSFLEEDRNWAQVQAKTFTKWANNQLGKESNLFIQDILHDLSDGTILIKLLEIIGKESLGRHNIKPGMRIQKVENINKALEFIKERGVGLTNIGAEDIVDVNPKLTLGLIWMIILRFTISEIREEGLTAKDALLAWCQRKTASYEEVRVVDFSSSWQDGLAFCALIHKHRPDLLDYNKLNKNDFAGNTNLAFNIAESELGIPKLLDVEDVCFVKNPDSKSIMTYVAQYFHAFSSQSKTDTAGRRLRKLTDLLQSVYGMKNNYEQRSRKLISDIKSIQKNWESSITNWSSLQKYSKNETFPTVNNYQDAQNDLKSLNHFKLKEKRLLMMEKLELNNLLSDIQTRLTTFQLAPYNPQPDILPSSIDKHWEQLGILEINYRKELLEKVKNFKKTLALEFANEATQLHEEITQIETNAAVQMKTLADQLYSTKVLYEQHLSLEALLSSVEIKHKNCLAAEIEENEYTSLTFDELLFDYELIESTLNKKVKQLENQMVLRNSNALSVAQLEEFESVFKSFDRSKENSLSDAEFRAALETLDLTYSEDEFSELFGYLSSQSYEQNESRGFDANGIENELQNEMKVSFESYIRFLVAVFEDQNNPSQVYDSFVTASNGKPFITTNDLQYAGLSSDQVDCLEKLMPKFDNDKNKLDYAKYIDDIFH